MTNTAINTPPGGWETLAGQIARRQPEALTLLNRLYRELFNEDIRQACGNCYNKAWYRIQKHLYLHQPQSMQATNTNQYRIKSGRSLQTVFGGDVLTNANLTDEAAEKLLLAHPALIEHFEHYPAGDEETTGQESGTDAVQQV